ncbi:hypothetical protein [Candidatus Palauibacter sp.]|uniref:hypothetical protein n=1 Tax=Candidatus Palauibacter sp. TaxID=3101350 RepID=UPI003B51F37B
MSRFTVSPAFLLLPVSLFAMANPAMAEITADDFGGFAASRLMEAPAPSVSDPASPLDRFSVPIAAADACREIGAARGIRSSCGRDAFIEMLAFAGFYCGHHNFRVHEFHCILLLDGREHWMVRFTC